MKILVNGLCGYMGNEIVRAAQRGYGNAEVVGGIDLPGCNPGQLPCATSIAEAEAMFPANTADCLIDFSHHSCTEDLMAFAVKTKTPIVVATTGHTPEELAMISQAAKEIPVFHSANMSVGVALLVKLAKTAAAAMPDAEMEITLVHSLTLHCPWLLSPVAITVPSERRPTVWESPSAMAGLQKSCFLFAVAEAVSGFKTCSEPQTGQNRTPVFGLKQK